jgi:endonuclease YncB( thermonuclease family)
MLRRSCFVILLIARPACAEPITPGELEVLDGDTIRAHRVTVVRLVGFDAPETYRARCESERAKGSEAARRLRMLVAGGGLDLTLIRCSCPAGTEGTPRCNYGRRRRVLTVRGKDVAEIMIAEGLARKYVCGATSCPQRQSWCDGQD